MTRARLPSPGGVNISREVESDATLRHWQDRPIVRTIRIIPLGLPMNLRKLLFAVLLLSLPAMAQAADITGVPKIREGDHLQIGNSRIRLGGIDAPSVDQLCLNTKGERWACGAAARDELIKRFGSKSWTCHARGVTDRRGRITFRHHAPRQRQSHQHERRRHLGSADQNPRRRPARSRPRPTAPSRAMSTAPASASFTSQRAAGMRRSR